MISRLIIKDGRIAGAFTFLEIFLLGTLLQIIVLGEIYGRFTAYIAVIAIVAGFLSAFAWPTFLGIVRIRRKQRKHRREMANRIK